LDEPDEDAQVVASTLHVVCHDNKFACFFEDLATPVSGLKILGVGSSILSLSTRNLLFARVFAFSVSAIGADAPMLR
jgi:hypothetical protein